MPIKLLLIHFAFGCNCMGSVTTVYTLEDDSLTITARQGDKIKWQVKVLDTCGRPAVGENKIRMISEGENKIHVFYGKHSFADIDKNNGKVECIGAD